MSPAPERPDASWERCGCSLCGAPPDRAQLVYRFAESAYHRCRACGLVYLDPRLTERSIQALYQGQDYFAGNTHFGYETYEDDAAVHRRTFERRLEELRRFKPTGRVLDVGCGTGIFLDVATAHGYDAWGIDASRWAVASRPELGERIRAGTLDDLDVPAGFFDAVTLFDVFEHVYHPTQFAAQLARITAQDAIVLIATPNYDSWMRRLLGARTVSFKIPEHVCYYTRETLARAVSGHFHLAHAASIGQYCTTSFLARRLAGVHPLLGRLFTAGVGALGLSGWQPYVPSGSLLAVLQKRRAA